MDVPEHSEVEYCPPTASLAANMAPEIPGGATRGVRIVMVDPGLVASEYAVEELRFRLHHGKELI